MPQEFIGGSIQKKPAAASGVMGPALVIYAIVFVFVLGTSEGDGGSCMLGGYDRCIFDMGQGLAIMSVLIVGAPLWIFFAAVPVMLFRKRKSKQEGKNLP